MDVSRSFRIESDHEIDSIFPRGAGSESQQIYQYASALEHIGTKRVQQEGRLDDRNHQPRSALRSVDRNRPGTFA